MEERTSLKEILTKMIYTSVRHLILRALAIWASDPQNALAWISFHSPNLSNQFSHLSFLLFNTIEIYFNTERLLK